MKVKTIYELGDQVKVTGVPTETFGSNYGRLLGKVLTVVESVAGFKWLDEEFVQLRQLNNDIYSEFEFEYYTTPVMQNSEFRVGQVVKCVNNDGWYGLTFEVGDLYTVGVDKYGDTGPIDRAGYTLRPDETKTTFILQSPAPLSASETEVERLEKEVKHLTALVAQKTEEVIQLRNVIGKVEDILSEA